MKIQKKKNWRWGGGWSGVVGVRSGVGLGERGSNVWGRCVVCCKEDVNQE